jgi:hypothetical protein
MRKFQSDSGHRTNSTTDLWFGTIYVILEIYLKIYDSFIPAAVSQVIENTRIS